MSKIDFSKLATLLDEGKSYSDLSIDVLTRLKREHEELFESLPQKDLPIEEQSELEKAIRADYDEICEILSKN